MLGAYLRDLWDFDRNVRLYLISGALVGFAAAGGIYTVLAHLYITEAGIWFRAGGVGQCRRRVLLCPALSSRGCNGQKVGYSPHDGDWHGADRGGQRHASHDGTDARVVAGRMARPGPGAQGGRLRPVSRKRQPVSDRRHRKNPASSCVLGAGIDAAAGRCGRQRGTSHPISLPLSTPPHPH